VLKELYAQLWTNVQSIEHVSIRLYESDALKISETVLIKNSFFLWCGIISEKASSTLDESSFSKFGGRLLQLPSIVLRDKRGFAAFLSMLDEVDDDVTSVISTSGSQFKAAILREKLRRSLCDWSPVLWRTLSPLISSLLKDDLCSDDVRFLREISNLMSKIHIEREDLLADSIEEYKTSEDLSFAESSVQAARSKAYTQLISRVRYVLRDVVAQFNMGDCMPKHGPGAVSLPGIRTPVEKYLNMGRDPRIDYVLRPYGLRMDDFSPFDLGDTDRTSRVVFVPKSWKKLRGISAEPVGLQYFQQAVNSKILEAISNSSLRSVINLRSQTRSRVMAKRGSFDGSLSTIDLSSASDSVTLQLVKDVFGNTELCRWLLATRSTHTSLYGEVLRINKFAPMGSACCFPVECLLFAGIALAAASIHHGWPVKFNKSFRVYGDDIICPTSFAPCIVEALTLCGFTVNSGKSYWYGDYRESCGMDAWRGVDVTPLKLKDFSFDFGGATPLSYEHHSRVISYLNYLYNRGYKHLRSFLLGKFLRCHILALGQKIKVQDSLVFGFGERGTVASIQPDNFHLVRVPYKGYQRPVLKVFGWKPKHVPLSAVDEIRLFEVNYFEFLMRNRAEKSNKVRAYDLVFFRLSESKAEKKKTSSMRMVPTASTFDPWIRVGRRAQ